MNAMIPTLLFVSAVATGFAPQSAAQRAHQPREPITSAGSGSRVPVDVSLQGLGDASQLALADAAPAGNVFATPSVGSVSPLAFSCAPSIRDQTAGGCLQASSTPTSGVLFPYPGINNEFAPPGFVGGGVANNASAYYATVGGGSGNTASGNLATVAGGSSNTASGNWATVGGGRKNAASGSQATVGGGFRNTASGTYATVGGGRDNTASGSWPTVGGGYGNTASGDFATVPGGRSNTAYGNNATVAGGRSNTASGSYATVAGGRTNIASGTYAMVAGGRSSTAMGDYSFAAGRVATANHDGAFVWGGNQLGVNKTSSLADEFNVYCTGGARFFSNSAATTGVLLAPGGGSWSAVSDRDSKENVEPVDGRAILAQVVSMPLSTWNYKAQADSIRHIGPMAQDFHAAFGLGASDKLIDTIDPDGVALAAIQGLNAELQERLAENDAEIEERLAAKDAEIADLQARLDRLELLAMAKLGPQPTRTNRVGRTPPHRLQRTSQLRESPFAGPWSMLLARRAVEPAERGKP